MNVPFRVIMRSSNKLLKGKIAVVRHERRITAVGLKMWFTSTQTRFSEAWPDESK